MVQCGNQRLNCLQRSDGEDWKINIIVIIIVIVITIVIIVIIIAIHKNLTEASKDWNIFSHGFFFQAVPNYLCHQWIEVWLNWLQRSRVKRIGNGGVGSNFNWGLALGSPSQPWAKRLKTKSIQETTIFKGSTLKNGTGWNSIKFFKRLQKCMKF